MVLADHGAEVIAAEDKKFLAELGYDGKTIDQLFADDVV